MWWEKLEGRSSWGVSLYPMLITLSNLLVCVWTLRNVLTVSATLLNVLTVSATLLNVLTVSATLLNVLTVSATLLWPYADVVPHLVKLMKHAMC